MRARDVMSAPVTTVPASATLLEAARLLVNTRVSALPVVDDGNELVGIVSEIDLIANAVGADLSRLDADDVGSDGALSAKVSDIMTQEVVTATEEATLTDIAALMLQRKTKRIPIVSGRTVSGIVSRIDLVKAMLSREPGRAATPVVAALAENDTLREAVAAAMHKLGLPLGTGFDVVVRNGTVHLWGQVADDEQVTACRRAAAALPGVTDVMSHMQVFSLRHRWR